MSVPTDETSAATPTGPTFQDSDVEELGADIAQMSLNNQVCGML